MNRHDYLKLFDNVKDKYVMEALESRESVRPVMRKDRMVLIAAVVALALLLMGCVSAFLGLQQRKIGEIPVTQKFDAYGNPIANPEKTWYIASMSGFDSSPAQQASQEWNEFQRTYQPENLTNETDLPDIPNRFEYTYHCYDQTMVDKVNEIAETYSLDLLGERAVAQSWQREAAFEALGITHLVQENVPAEAAYGACRVYPPYNFVCDVRLSLIGEDAPWKEEVYCEVYYLQSGYLAHDDAFVYDPETTLEWEYTAADGTTVLLALSGADGIVLAQREDSTIVIQMDMAWQQGVFLDEGTALPTKEALESLADCFDYTIATQAAPMEGLQKTFDAISDPNAAPDDYEVPQYANYSAYLNENYLWPELVEYAFHDIDGDGEKDLITSYGDGFCINWLTIRDGQVKDITGGRGAMRLCENGIVEIRDPVSEQYLYYKILGSDPEVGVKLDSHHSISHFSGEWKIDNEICTEQEALTLIAQYNPLQLHWESLLDFPMDDKGGTFADVLTQEGNLSGTALLDYYGENYDIDREYWNGEMTWFELRDINHDGIEDLLLSVDGEKIDAAYTYKRGRFINLEGDFYLCKGNVMHSWDQVDRYNEGVVQRHRFLQLEGQNYRFYYRMNHNLSTGVWEDTNYKEITEAEAQSFLSQYPRVKMNMRPISDLID